MIVVAGGSGRLGLALVRRLLARGEHVRVLSRDPERARQRLGALAGVDTTRLEVVVADVRDRESLLEPLRGADVVVSAVQGFGGEDAAGLRAIDADGNATLIRAAADGAVGRFVLMSMQGAAASSPLALGRAKAHAEDALAASGLPWAIIRPSTYLETWVSLIGDPIVASGRARVFGRGRNPINFVSADDVAGFVDGIIASAVAGRIIEIRGPEDLTFDDLVGRFADAIGRPVPASHVPPLALRLLSTVLRPVRPIVADQIRAALVMDEMDLRAHPEREAPMVGSTTVDDVIRTYLRDHPVVPAVPPGR